MGAKWLEIVFNWAESVKYLPTLSKHSRQLDTNVLAREKSLNFLLSMQSTCSCWRPYRRLSCHMRFVSNFSHRLQWMFILITIIAMKKLTMNLNKIWNSSDRCLVISYTHHTHTHTHTQLTWVNKIELCPLLSSIFIEFVLFVSCFFWLFLFGSVCSPHLHTKSIYFL